MSNMNVKLFLVAALYVTLFSRVQCENCKVCIKDLTSSQENGITLKEQSPTDDGCKRDIKFDVNKCISNLVAVATITMESGDTKEFKVNSNDGQKDIVEKMAGGGDPDSSSDDNCSMKQNTYSVDDLSTQALQSLGSEKATAMDIEVFGNDNEKMVVLHADVEYKGC